MPYREMDFDYILNHTKKPMCLMDKGVFIRCNSAMIQFLGYNNEKDLIGKFPEDISPKFQDNGQKSSSLGNEKLREVADYGGTSFEWTHLRSDGEKVYIRVIMTKIEHETNDIILGMWDDITDEKRKEEKIIESEKKFRTIFESMEEGIALCEMIYDNEKVAIDYKILDINPKFEKIFDLKKKNIVGKSAMNFLDTQNTPYIDIFDNVVKTRKSYKFEVNEKKYGIFFRISVFHTEGYRFAAIFEDITEKKKQEEKIMFLTYHDILTGLYNRTYYEEIIKKIDTQENLPISIIMLDVNGLKMANDTFGHEFGDYLLKSASNKINKYMNEKYFAARIGGDEFIIIMPKTDYDEATKIMEKIENEAKESSEDIEVSLSAGVATKKYNLQNMNQIIMLADQMMYKKKQKYGSEIRKKIISKVLENLDRDMPWEKEHRENVKNGAILIGKAMNLEKVDMERLEKVALFHNIGKIGVPKEILHKTSPLTKEELEIVKNHSEIGYRLIRAVPEYASIADEILLHHERPDGKGYPKGLLGEDIPLLTKIVSVVCAYEDMISDRPYKKALSKEKAKEKLIKNSGTQFDSKIVSIFLDLIIER